MKKLKVLLLFDYPEDLPIDFDYTDYLKDPDWTLENRLLKAVQKNGHEAAIFSIHKRIDLLISKIADYQPDVIFNCADVFNGQSHFDKNIASVIEMLEIPFTGASPAGLLICNDKALAKKILTFHRIRVPQFYTFYRSQKIKVAKKLKLPCVVKPLSEEASRGISLASVVDSRDALIDRVKFIHESMELDAIVEEYIDGREFYVSIFGNKRITVLPFREMIFGNLPEDEPRIATYKAKWDNVYRKRWQIDNVAAVDLDPAIIKEVEKICKRAYRALNMKGYARFDIRITKDNKIFIIEPNANPSLLPDDEFVLSAKKAGISFEELVDQLIKLALQA